MYSLKRLSMSTLVVASVLGTTSGSSHAQLSDAQIAWTNHCFSDDVTGGLAPLYIKEVRIHECLMQMKFEKKHVAQAKIYRQSDLADCRSRAKMTVGPLETKEVVMDDCLEARRLRSIGR